MTPKGQSARESRLRREGYADGRAGLPAKRKDAVYQQAWRKGWDARIALARDMAGLEDQRQELYD